MRAAPAVLVLAFTLGGACQPAPAAREVHRLVPVGALPLDLPAHPASPGQPSHATGSARTDGGARGARDAAGAAGAVTITDREAPAGALGVHWGMTRAEVTTANHAAGVTCRDSGEYLFCPRAMVPVPTSAVATYEFCDDHLCSVALDGARTRDEARVDQDYRVLLGVMQGELGTPATDTRRVAQGCTGHLALCLTSRQAELRARWSWHNGAQAMVSADQDEDDAFLAQVSATYLSPARARRNDPEPPPYVTTWTDAGTPSR